MERRFLSESNESLIKTLSNLQKIVEKKDALILKNKLNTQFYIDALEIQEHEIEKLNKLKKQLERKDKQNRVLWGSSVTLGLLVLLNAIL